MTADPELKETIRSKVEELARGLGRRVTVITDDDLLLETGILDSAAVLELLVSIETLLDIELEQAELSPDNFGSINLMVGFLSSRRAN
jgi:acyl carrier protein